MKNLHILIIFCCTYVLFFVSCANDEETASFNQLPFASFSYSDSIVLFNETITFTDESTDPDGNIVWWLWNFEDGKVSTDQNTSHTFSVLGTYNVRLTVRDDDEGESEIRKQIIVKESNENTPPVARFNLSNELFQTGQTIEILNTSSDSDGTIVAWQWDFGNGDTSTEESPVYTYGNTGEYTVTLTVTDDSGDSDSHSESLTIWGAKWSFATGSDIKPSSPAIGDDGTIYIGSYDSKIYALNSDGTLKWEYLTGARINTSPAVGDDGSIYCGSDDDNMYAINPDGTLRWSFLTGGNIVYSTPAIANDGTIYFGSDDDKIYAINSDGSLKWEVITGDNVRCSPAIASDGTVYVTSNDGKLYAFNPDGTELWNYEIGGKAESGPAIDSDGTVFIGVDLGGSAGKVYAINSDGSEKWGVDVLGRISVGSPALSSDGALYIGTKEGHNLLALKTLDGSLIWNFVVDDTSITNSSPAIGADGVIYFGSWDDGVYALNPDGTVKLKFTTGGDVWSSPAIGIDGTIYIGSYDGSLYALDMLETGLADSVWPMFGKDVKHSSRAE